VSRVLLVPAQWWGNCFSGDAAASGEVEQEAVLGAGEALRSFMEVRIFGDQSSVKSKDSSISLSLCFCKPA